MALLVCSDDFIKQTNGMIMIYSLKNPSYPEFIYSTESGVMCLDIHPKHPHLLAVGFYDGSVGVFNVTDRSPTPLYHSTAKTGASYLPSYVTVTTAVVFTVYSMTFTLK